MSIRVRCSSCKASLKVKDKLAGRRIKCPRCQSELQVGATSETGDTVADVPATTDSGPWLENVPDEEEFADDDIFGGLGDLLQSDVNPEYVGSDELYSPERKQKKRQAETTESSAEPEKKSLSAPLLLGAMFIGGLLMSAVVMLVLSSWFSDSIEQSVVEEGPAAIETRGFTDADEMLGRLPGVLNEMETLLNSNQLREFVVRFAPLDQVAQLREAEIHTTKLPSVPRQQLLLKIRRLHSGTTALLDGGWKAEIVLQEEVEAGSLSAAPGYGSDIAVVLESSVKDLQAEKYQSFVRKMFPESVQLQMNRNGVERGPLPALSPESPMVVYMLRDLTAMQQVKPKINGSTAVFLIPRMSGANGFSAEIRSDGSHQAGDREIRLSLVGGSWRFYDNPAGVEGVTGSRTYRMQFERIGDAWRLATWPE